MMSLRHPSRKALQAAATVNTSLTPALSALSISSPNTPNGLPIVQRRSAWFDNWFGGSNKNKKENKNARSTPKNTDVNSVKGRAAIRDQFTSTSTLDDTSIFSSKLDAATKDGKTKAPVALKMARGGSLLKEHTWRGTDPDPRSRVRWERKQVMRMVKRDLDIYGKETKEERIKRTERSMQYLADKQLPTSTKKLVHLARQVAGKTVDEAIVQMQFSKKMMAKEILMVLERGKGRAIVERGMGLGHTTGEGFKRSMKYTSRDGKWVETRDPTRIYIDQAWVTKGPPRGYLPDYRARGRTNKIIRPQAKINFIFKEEKTRIREYREKQEKKARQGPWLHLPDRPVTAQRPYYSW